MKFTPTTTKFCEICGDEFWPEARAQRCCKKVHTRPCPICSAPVKIKYKSDKIKCCSKKCTLALRKQTNLANWDVDNPAKCDAIKEKQAATCLDKYGVSTPFLMDDFAEKAKHTSQQTYGTDHPMQSEQIKSKHKAHCLANNGQPTPLTIPRVREAQKIAYANPNIAKRAAHRRSDALARCIASDGVCLDSGYELAVYEFCIRNMIILDRQIPLQYEYEGDTHLTYIDFKIEDLLVECKGSHLLAGCFDHAVNMVPIDAKLNAYRQNNVIIVTDVIASHMFETSEFMHLCGVDIELFKLSNVDEVYVWQHILNHIKQGHGFLSVSDMLQK